MTPMETPIKLAVLILFLSIPLAVAAQSPSPTPAADQATPKKTDRDPIENADEFKSKLTFGIYFVRGAQAYDLNLRHQFGNVTAWIAGYKDTNRNQLIRVGAQYDYHKAWFHFVPTGEVETTKGASLSLYSELGRDTVAIVG